MKISITELASLTGFDRRRITTALADLKHEKGGKGAKLYESADALLALFTGSSFDDKKERGRLTHHQANLAGLQEDELRGELVRVEDVEKVVGDHVAACRAKLLNLPAKVTPLVLGMETPEEVTATLESVLWEALAELANQYDGHQKNSGTMGTAAET